jgi:hypothetical protein
MLHYLLLEGSPGAVIEYLHISRKSDPISL